MKYRPELFEKYEKELYMEAEKQISMKCNTTITRWEGIKSYWYKGRLQKRVNTNNGIVLYFSKEYYDRIDERYNFLLDEIREQKIRDYREYRERAAREKLEEKRAAKRKLNKSRKYGLPFEYNIKDHITEIEEIALREHELKINGPEREFNEPFYIDKYTTAYNSEVVRAIMSHNE